MASYKIFVAGRTFDCDAKVVTWHESGWDHSLERCVLEKVRCAGGVAAYGEKAINRRPNRFWYRRGLGHTKTPDLRAAQAAIRMFTIHHDGCPNASTTFKVLHDERGISVHFIIDNDGTIYQNLDLALMGFQAAGFNPWSVGVEMCNRGDAKKYPGYYGVKKSRGPARESTAVKIHRHTYLAYRFTDQQHYAMEELARALRYALPNIPVEYPQERPGKQIWKMMPNPQKFNGYMGHYHQTTRKWDPGPFDFKRFCERVRGTQCWPLATKKLDLDQCQQIPDDIEELRADADAYYKLNASASGGFFPIAPYGKKRLWHGGIHIPRKRGEPIRTPFAGFVVAARYGTTSPVGSNDFVLIRHDATVGPISFRFFALYYHLDNDIAKETPPEWITVALERKKKNPGQSGLLDPAKKGQVQLIGEPIKGGAVLGHVGEAGPPRARASQIHFEIFSSDSIVSEVELTGLPQSGLWKVVDGTSGGRFCDAPEILDLIDKNPDDDKIEEGEISSYYRTVSKDLHYLAVLNTSEWYGSKDEWLRDLRLAPEFQGIDDAELDKYFRDQIEPTLWWDKNVARHARIPSDGVVFHFHPITFIRFLNEKVLEAAVEDEKIDPKDASVTPEGVTDDSPEDEKSGESFFAESDLGDESDADDYPLERLVQGFED